jgi:hypothetical protein
MGECGQWCAQGPHTSPTPASKLRPPQSCYILNDNNKEMSEREDECVSVS